MTYWALNGVTPPIIDEFGQDSTEPPGSEHNDDCGPCGETNGNAALTHTKPTYTQMHAIRNRDIAHKPDAWFTAGSGNRIDNINNDVITYMKRSTVFYAYHEWYGAADIRAICENHQNTAIVIGICQAHLLPFNEAGVFCHYVVGLAYDSTPVRKDANGKVTATGKILIGNGDREPHGGPDWIWIEDLAACQMYGFVVMIGAATVMTLQVTQTDGKYTANADGSWHCVPTGKNLGGGMQNYYRGMTSPYATLAGWTALGLAQTDETPIGKPKTAGAFQPVIQIFERGALIADPDKAIDSPPGAGTVYLAHLNNPAVLAFLGVSAAPIPPAPPVDVTAEYKEVAADLAKATTDLGALKTKLGPQVKS